MELDTLLKEIRRIMMARNIDNLIRSTLTYIVRNAWENIEEAEG